jgi:hypothetical protein
MIWNWKWKKMSFSISSKYSYFKPIFNYTRKGLWKGILICQNCDTLMFFHPDVKILKPFTNLQYPNPIGKEMCKDKFISMIYIGLGMSNYKRKTKWPFLSLWGIFKHKLSYKIIPMIFYMDSSISKYYIKFFMYFSIHYSDYIFLWNSSKSCGLVRFVWIMFFASYSIKVKEKHWFVTTW